MNVVVTGGCGFIGLNTVEKLIKQGHEIAVMDKSRLPEELDKSVTLVNTDIRNLNEVIKASKNGHDLLIHLAAKSDARNMQDFRLFKEINIDGTLNVLEAARKNDINSLIFASSSHVYGEKKEKRFKEADPINPVSHYGATKFIGETMCRAYSEFYGISCMILRFFTVYGPRGRTDMAVMKFIQSIYNGEPISVHGNGRIQKDFVYIDDVSDAIIKCLDTKMKFEVINIGSGKATELNRIITLIENGLGKKAKKLPVPIQPGDVMYSCADITKAKRLLKWKPKISIETGIQKTVDWWKDNSYSEAI